MFLNTYLRFNVDGVSSTYISVHHVCAWCLKKTRRGSNTHPPELKIQMAVSHHVSDGIQTRCSAGTTNVLSTPEEIQS